MADGTIKDLIRQAISKWNDFNGLSDPMVQFVEELGASPDLTIGIGGSQSGQTTIHSHGQVVDSAEMLLNLNDTNLYGP